MNSFHLCEHPYWVLNRKKKKKNAFISPMVKENYLIELIKNSFEDTIHEVIYIDIANPENNPVRIVRLLLTGGSFYYK